MTRSPTRTPLPAQPEAQQPQENWPTNSVGTTYSSMFAALAVFVFMLSWLKGFRFPNLWSATHFTFNYSQGFVRRGAIGELARQLGGDHIYTYKNFVVLSGLVFVTVAILLAIALRRALAACPRDPSFRAAILAFAASPGVVFLVHIIGYNDYFGILAVLFIVLCCAHQHTRPSIFYATLLVSAPLALIHEGLAFMFGPVLVLAMGCHILRLAQQHALTRTAWLSSVVCFACATASLIGMSALVSLLGSENVDAIRALHDYSVAHADFPIRHKAFDALQRPSSEAITRVMPWYWSVAGHLTDVPWSWKAFTPGFLWLLTYGTSTILGVAVPSRSKWILVVLFIAASIAPLGFNFVGWDWGRWNALATVSCFLAILTIKLYFPSRAAEHAPRWLLTTGLMITALGLATTTPLFDGFNVQFFPFNTHQDLFLSIPMDDFQYQPKN